VGGGVCADAFDHLEIIGVEAGPEHLPRARLGWLTLVWARIGVVTLVGLDGFGPFTAESRKPMSNHDGHRPANRRPLLVTAALISAGAVIVAIAVATGALRLGKSGDPAPSAEQSAQQRCESEVTKKLVSPAKATISDVRTESSILDIDGRDFSSLAASAPLKGIDTSSITVLNVSGVVNAPSEVGSTIQDHFDCRAYSVDGALAHTLVIFDHGH